MYANIASRVKAGAEFLDEEVPGWYKRVDTDLLDLSSPVACILGQTFQQFVGTAFNGGQFHDGYQAGLKRLNLDDEDATRLGFDGRPDDAIKDEYDRLGVFWKRAIGRRLVAEGQRLVK